MHFDGGFVFTKANYTIANSGCGIPDRKKKHECMHVVTPVHFFKVPYRLLSYDYIFLVKCYGV
jgi:hypothetical protein